METIMNRHRPEIRIHPDDRQVPFDQIRREFIADPYVSIDLVIYRDQGTRSESYAFYRSDEIQFLEDRVIFKHREGDQVAEVLSTDEFDQNWYANRMGYILRVYR
jgi:hypothetical protein